MRIGVATLVLALVPGAAIAAASPKPDPQLEAHVQRVITDTEHGADVFRADEFGNVIHIQSGMQCTSAAGHLVRLIIPPDVPIGEAAGCEYTLELGWSKIIILVSRRDGSFNDYAAAADRLIRKDFPDAEPPTTVMALSDPATLPCQTAKYPVVVEGHKAFSSVWMFDQSGWVIEVYATYPAVGAVAEELPAAMACFVAQHTIREHSAKP